MKIKLLVPALALILGATAFAVEDMGGMDHKTPTTAPTTGPAAINTKCPVSGEDIDPATFIMQDGKKICFCCKDCVKEYQANPAKFADKLK